MKIGDLVKRIIVGDFKNIDKIEKIIFKEKLTYEVFVDFESIGMTKFNMSEYDQIIVYAEKIETLDRESEFLINNKEKIILWLKGKKIAEYKMILQNQDYKVVKSIKYLDKLFKTSNRKSLKNNKKIIGIYGNYYFAIQMAEALSEMYKVLFIDSDIENCLFNKMIKSNADKEKIYLNEPFIYDVFMKNNKFRNFHVITFTEKYHEKIDCIIENVINRTNDEFNIQIIYFNDENTQIEFEKKIFVSEIYFENIVKMNRLMKSEKEGVYIGIKNRSNIGDYYFLKANLLSKNFIVFNSKNFISHNQMVRWLDLNEMTKKMKGAFIKAYEEL